MSRPAMTFILVSTLFPFAGTADESAAILRQGVFREITDSASAGYKLYTARMSANGQVIAFTTSASDEFFMRALRVVNADGSNERLIAERPEGETYPAPFESYAVTDDGSKIVYGRQVGHNGFHTLTEIREFDTAGGTDRLVLAEVPHTSANATSPRQIGHFAGNGSLLALSGDGQFAYIVNAFGPHGNGNTDIDPDGQTIYRVDVAAGTAAKVISVRDFASVPGMHENAEQAYVASARLATNADGSVLVAPIGGAGTIPRPRTLMRFDFAKGGTGEVLLNFDGGSLTGPDLSGDGALLAFATYDDGALADGVRLMNADGSGEAAVLDLGATGGGDAIEPRLNADGTVIIDRSDLGGAVEPSIRWVPADGSDILLVSGDDTIIPSSSFQVHSVSADGLRIAFIGRIRSGAGVSGSDIIVFDWALSKGLPAGVPAVTSVVTDGDFQFPRQPGVQAEATERFTYTPDGADLGYMQAIAYDTNASTPNGLIGLGNSTTNVIDNGAFGDETAGDGVYNDAGVWAQTSAPLATVTGRAAITSTNGTASFVDYPIVIRDPVPPAADFIADVTSGEAPLAVTFTNVSAGDVNFADWDFDNNGSFNVNGAAAPVEHTYTDPGVYAVRMRARGFGNQDEAVKAMYIEVLEPGDPADLDDDGAVNAVDIQLVINAVLGVGDPGIDADVNGDGSVDAVDVQLLINAALGI